MKNVNNISLRTIEDLHEEIKRVKQRIVDTEESLLEKLTEVPVEAAKTLVQAVLPLFLGKELASRAWKLMQGALDLLSGKNAGSDSKDGLKDNMVGGEKKLGIFTAFRLLYNLWKSK